jgi:lipopolysaccharide export system protein LptC
MGAVFRAGLAPPNASPKTSPKNSNARRFAVLIPGPLMMIGHRHEGMETLGVLIGVAVIVWATGAWLTRVEPARRPAELTQAPAPAARPAVEPADVAITGVQLLHTPMDPAAQPMWELSADSAQLFEGRREMVLAGLRSTLTTAHQATVVTLTGERGRLDLGLMNFDVMGEVSPLTMELNGRYRLTTSRLSWDNASGLLTTDQPIRLVGEGLTLTGTGLRWSSIDGTASVLRDVETVVEPE